MPKRLIPVALLLLAACETSSNTDDNVPVIPAPIAPEDLPFMGSWNCGVSVMTFLPDGYMPSNDDDPIPVTHFGVSGDRTMITLKDGATFAVQMKPDGTMTWFSGQTGDSFDCERVAG